MPMRLRVIGCVLALVALSVEVRAEIIDRVLAVVGSNIITLSDVTAVRRLGLIVAAGRGDPIAETLERLIDRALMLVEVERYAPPAPGEEAVDSALAAVRARFPDQAQLEAVLAASGMTADELRRHVRDDLRIQAYLDQRFGATLEPSDEEVLQYYRDHGAEFTRGGVLRPFSDASVDARAALIAERRARLIDDWVAGLRRRAEIDVLYLPTKTIGGLRDQSGVTGS